MADGLRRGRLRRLFLYAPACAWGLALLACCAPAGRASSQERLQAATALEGRRVLAIRLLGNERTRDTTVLRELYLQPGDAFAAALLARDLEFLQGLGLFAEVAVEPQVAPGGVILVYRLVERGEIRYGLVYPVGSYKDEKLQLGLVYRHRSLRGGREDFRLEGSLGREDRAAASLSRPWLAGYPLEQSVDLRYVKRDMDNPYELKQVGLGFWISLDPRRPQENRFLLRGILGRRQLDPDDGNRNEWVNALVLGYSRDSRNSYIQPTAGGLFQITGALYDPKLGSSVALIQSNLWLSRYQRLGRGWVSVLALESNNQSGTLFYKGVYSLGGLNSVRGYPSGEIRGWEEAENPADPDGKPDILLLGRNRLIVHGELRHAVVPRFTLTLPILGVVDIHGDAVLFGDAGWLWSLDKPLIPRGVEKSAVGGGAGLRLYTPLGDVMRMELGIGEAGRYRLHLGSGLSF